MESPLFEVPNSWRISLIRSPSLLLAVDTVSGDFLLKRGDDVGVTNSCGLVNGESGSTTGFFFAGSLRRDLGLVAGTGGGAGGGGLESGVVGFSANASATVS